MTLKLHRNFLFARWKSSDLTCSNHVVYVHECACGRKGVQLELFTAFRNTQYLSDLGCIFKSFAVRIHRLVLKKQHYLLARREANILLFSVCIHFSTSPK